MNSVLCALGITLLSTELPAAGWYHPDWAYRQKVTVQEGFFVTTDDLGDFPVLVRIAGQNAPIFSKAKPDGSEILFTAADGVTKLAHEIEVYRAANPRDLVCWVKLPTLFVDIDTTAYVYYGNAKAERQESRAQVWGRDYSAVWHLSEGKVTDSTANAYNADLLPSTELVASGKIAGALSFSNQGAIDFGSKPPLDLGSDKPFTVSTWVRRVEWSKQSFLFAMRGGWRFSYHNLGRWCMGLSDHPRGKGNRLDAFSVDREPIGTWHHIAGVYDASDKSLRIYVNGLEKRKNQTPALGDFGWKRPFLLGHPWKTDGLRFLLDEVRVSNVVRSSDWIAASYKNQSRPSLRVRLGAVERRP